ncbi:hypothetical protein WJX74_003092 [Apatococcus lobatus]|uniref:Uncharacterized protein n=2 Tax=Apatococcus TaxID=904362 RepID=A0AAW1TBV1_9CHLO
MSGKLLSSTSAEPVSLFGVLIAAGLLLVLSGLSFWLSLDLHRRLLTSACRCLAQLGALGYLLVPALALNSWWLLLVYVLALTAVASAEAVSRSTHGYQGMVAHVLACLAAAGAIVLAYSLLLIVQPQPWWDAQHALPILAMLLGITISAVSTGLSAALNDLAQGKDQVEMLLGLGASRWEALHGSLHTAALAALTPVLDQMSVMGLVAMPGFMAGQLLGGISAPQASRYQMVVMLLGAAMAGLASVAAVVLALLHASDPEHRLRLERLVLRPPQTSGVALWVHAQASKAWRAGRLGCRRAAGRLRIAWQQRRSAPRSQRPRTGWLHNAPLARYLARPSQTTQADGQDSARQRLREVMIASEDESFSDAGMLSDGDASEQVASPAARSL